MSYTVIVHSTEFKRLRSLSLVWRQKRDGVKENKPFAYKAVLGVTATLEEAIDLARPWQIRGIRVEIINSS